MFIRLFIVFLLLIAVLFLPWWAWLSLAVGFVFLLPSFWEIFPIFFFSDLLFALPESRFLGGVFLTVLSAALIYFIVNLLKKNLRA